MFNASSFMRIFFELMNTPIMMFLTSVLFIETLLLLAALFNGNMFKKILPKTVTIIRGVPGSGKRYLVSQLERDNEEIFSLCDRNDYFMNDGEFSFKGSELARSEQSSRLKLLDSISKGVRNIYIINYFNELWMYQEYLQIAKMHKYETQILEIPCIDNEHLSYFNKRSRHQTPFSKSKNCYNNWQSDNRAIYCEPFVKSFPGDCVPKLNIVDLDKQLDNYKNKVEGVEQEDSIEESNSLIKYGQFIEFISKVFYNKIFTRECSLISNLQKNIKYDLKEEKPIII